VALLDLRALLLEVDQEPDLVVVVALAVGPPELGEGAVELPRELAGPRCELDQHAPAIVRVRHPVCVAGALEAIDHRRDRAGGQAAGLRELAGAHPPVLIEDVEDPAVGAVHAEQLPDEVVDDVRRSLVGAHGVGEPIEQGLAGGRIIS